MLVKSPKIIALLRENKVPPLTPTPGFQKALLVATTVRSPKIKALLELVNVYDVFQLADVTDILVKSPKIKALLEVKKV